MPSLDVESTAGHLKRIAKVGSSILEDAIEADPIAEFREGIHDIDICDQTATRTTGQAE